MMKRGSYTLKTRSVLPSSSAANWASMFMDATIGYMFGVNQPQVWIGRPVKSIFKE